MKSMIAFVVAFIIFVGVMLLVRLGAFKPVSVTSMAAGPFRVVYKHHTGPYHKIVPVLESVEKWAAENQEACQTAFGEYIDNPDLIEEDRLNSNGGCVVNADWSGRLKEELMYREIPKHLYVVAEFEGAPSIGPQKVYPRATKFITDNGLQVSGPVIEMYERVSNSQIKTHYYFPVSEKK